MILALPTVDQMTDVLDIKPLERFSLFWFWFVLIVIFLLIAGYFVFLFFKHRKKEIAPVEVVIPEKILSPSEKALEAFTVLEKIGLLEKGQYRKYYFRLSEILKTFLEEEFKIEAVDATTEEIILHLSSSSLTADQRLFLETILKEMDLVKFAKAIPSKSETVLLRQSVREFLNRPLPKPPPIEMKNIHLLSPEEKGGE